MNFAFCSIILKNKQNRLVSSREMLYLAMIKEFGKEDPTLFTNSIRNSNL